MIRTWSGVALFAALAITAWAGGCGGGTNGYGSDDGGPADDSSGNETGMFGSDGTATQTLTVMPANTTIMVSGPGTTVQFQAFVTGVTMPVTADWTLDQALVGSIDKNGLFTASGTTGGKVTIEAQSGSLHGTTTLTIDLALTDNPGNVPANVQQQLTGGGNADPSLAWLYPYDATVFPRGLLPPVLQFAGTAPDAVYLHVSFSTLDYKGFYGASNPGQVAITPALWSTITQTASGTDNVKVEITKISGGQVSGPITESWRVAQGSLKGTVYYNSYSSQLSGSPNGTVISIKPGGTAQLLIGGPANTQCTVCHAVSADGSTLVASHYDYVSGASWDLKNNTAVIHEQGDSEFSFGGLYPDGTFLMSNGALTGSWPPNVPGQTQGPRASRLLDTHTGAQIAAPGFDGVITEAIAPAFSPTGKKMAFDHYDTTQGHTMAVMDFDVKSHTFSNLVDIYNDATNYLAWPAFTPDDEWMLFHDDSRQDFATWSGAKADVMVAHLPSKTVVALDALNGIKGGMPYLPYGANDVHMNYEPTILPVAVGGYYWAVFTSRRNYGNTIVTASQDDTPRKKLWVAAIDIDNPEHPSTMAKDISHPAFYLPGQEQAAGNMRGFWALDPCRNNGVTCDTGDECCGGFCRQQNEPDGSVAFVCVPKMGCANEYEKCVTDADCCGASMGFHCINGYCAQPSAN
jgi:hypothetical protein